MSAMSPPGESHASEEEGLGSVAGDGLTIVHLNTERGWRGGERQTLLLARELVALGHRSIVAARPGEPLADRAGAEGLEVLAVAPLGEADVVAAYRLRRALRRLRADIVHAHAAHAVGTAALATLGTRVPMVLTRRAEFPLRDNPGSRWKHGRAAAIVAISDAVRRSLLTSGIPEARIEVIPSGVDLSRPRAAADAGALRALDVPEGVPLVVMVGALTGEKDPATFVRAVAEARRRVPELRALLVGDGPLLGELTALVTELGLGDALRLPGFRRDADALIAAADVLVLTSRREGLGTVLLDALAAGTPVVATAAGGIPEIVEDGRSGLLAPAGDHRAIGEAVARILGDPALASSLAEGGRERVVRFSAAETARRTLAVYRRVRGGG